MTSVETIRDEAAKLSRNNHAEQAIELCTTAMAATAEGEVHRILGFRADARWDFGDVDGAIEDLQKAISAAPNWRGHRYALASYFLALGHFIDAERIAGELIALELRDNTVAFRDGALLIEAIARLQQHQWDPALESATAMQDEGAFRLCGATRTKSDIIELATTKRTLV